MEMLDRRRFLLLGLAGGVAAAGLARFHGPRRPVAIRPQREPASAELRAFLGDVREGARVDRWTVVAIHGAPGGAVVVMKTADGELFQVDVLRRDDGAPAVASSRSLGIYLHNAGRGRAASDEEHGLGAMALAAALDAREAAGARPPALLTLAERNARFPRGAFTVIG
jgi:hypothetical protein